MPLPNQLLTRTHSDRVVDKIDVYDHEKRLESELRKLDRSDIIEKNKQLILDFRKQLIAEGISIGRQAKVIHILLTLSKNIKKTFDTLNKDDVVNLVGFIETQKWTAWTKHDYKVILKSFFKWLKDSKDYPEEAAWIKSPCPKNSLLANQILTEEEVKRMVEVATNPRDKAFIFVLYESGCRIGELVTIRMKDVEFDEYGAFLNVTGKTGPRRVRIIKSVPLLTVWLNCHKDSKNPNTPLWVKLNNPRIEFLTMPTVRSFLKKVVRKAGIRKRVYPHLFRHSRATYLASQISESLLKKHMGWVQNSDMPATYVHLSGQELDKALLKASGIQVGEKPKEEKLNIIQCPRCRNDNSAGSKYCFSCGLCFDLKTAIEIDETKKKVNELLDALVKNPEKLETLLKLIQSKS